MRSVRMLTPGFVARPGSNSLPAGLAIKPLICRAEFAASAGTRPHSAAITARRGREGVRHVRDRLGIRIGQFRAGRADRHAAISIARS